MPFNPPVEIAMVVAEWAALEPYRGGVFHYDNRTLLALRLVSRLWTEHARRLLYRKVRLRATSDGVVYRSAFAAFVREIHGLRRARSRLPAEVRALSIGCQSAYFGTTVDLSAISTLVQLLPGLRALHVTLLCAHLEIPDTFAFDTPQLAVLRSAPAARSITHLSMRSHISDPNVLHQLLGGLPNLRTLTIEAPRHTTVYEPALALPCMRRLLIDAQVSRKCLAYLYACVFSLRSLVLATLNDLARCAAHFSDEPHRVRELIVLDSGWDDTAESLAPGQLHGLATTFPHLTRLVVGFALPRAVLDTLPTALTYFGFDPYMGETVVDDALAWLESRPFVLTVGTVYHPEIDDECESEQVRRVRGFCRQTGRKWSEIYRMFIDEIPSNADDDDDMTPRAQPNPLPGPG